MSEAIAAAADAIPGAAGAPEGRTLLLTGPPRSGTTLVCHLLNRAEGVVALHEPVPLSRLRRHVFGRTLDPRRLADRLEGELARARASLLIESWAVCKQRGGEVPDNPVGDDEAGPGPGGAAPWRTRAVRLSRRLHGESALRRGQVARGRLRVGKPLTEGFLLCAKHPSLYTALLDELVPRWPVFAVVRNPLATLGSWRSVEFAVSRGRARAAERLHPDLARRLAAERDLTARQLLLLDWFFARIRDLVPAERVLRYEDTIGSGGANLEAIVGRPLPPDPTLASRNENKRYDRDLMLRLGERLLGAGGAWSSYYTPAAIERLIETYERWGVEADAAP